LTGADDDFGKVALSTVHEKEKTMTRGKLITLARMMLLGLAVTTASLRAEANAPKFRNNVSLYNNLIKAIETVNAEVHKNPDKEADDHFMELMAQVSDAANAWRNREVDATDVKLVTADKKSYSGGKVTKRAQMHVEYNYMGAHYSDAGALPVSDAHKEILNKLQNPSKSH
jgi:hypothetical protein